MVPYTRAKRLQPTIRPSLSRTVSAVSTRSSVERPSALAALAVIADTISTVPASGSGRSTVGPKRISTNSIPLTSPKGTATWLARATPSDLNEHSISPSSVQMFTVWGVKLIIFIWTPLRAFALAKSNFVRDHPGTTPAKALFSQSGVATHESFLRKYPTLVKVGVNSYVLKVLEYFISEWFFSISFLIG